MNEVTRIGGGVFILGIKTLNSRRIKGLVFYMVEKKKRWIENLTVNPGSPQALCMSWITQLPLCG